MMREEKGFTLLEVLVAVSLLGLVFGVVSAAFVVSLEVSDDSTERLTESQGGAFTSAWFTRDMQSAQTVDLAGAACPAATGAHVLSATWQDEAAVGGTVTYKVDYRLDGSTLVRTSCGAGPMTQTLARNLKTAEATCPAMGCSEVRLALQGLGDSDFVLAARRRVS